MGMYTELCIALDLKLDPTESEEHEVVVQVLNYLSIPGDLQPPRPPELPDHPLFKCERWDQLFRQSSYSFPGDSLWMFRYDDIQETWKLTTRFNLKNYEQEIQHFLLWIHPYVDPYLDQEFVGYYRYEDHPGPTLIFYREGASFWFQESSGSTT